MGKVSRSTAEAPNEPVGDDVSIGGSIPGIIDLFDLATGAAYNPSLYRLTTDEGEVFIVDESGGLQSLTDRNGNSLTIAANGIFHSSGQSITFVRDGLGRIQQIVDPAGNVLHYGFTPDGNLDTFTDRTGTNLTSFAYTNTVFPHYLTGITDPRGVTALRNEFGADGRLERQIDAQGRVTAFAHDLAQQREIITNRLGHVTVHELSSARLAIAFARVRCWRRFRKSIVLPIHATRIFPRRIR